MNQQIAGWKRLVNRSDPRYSEVKAHPIEIEGAPMSEDAARSQQKMQEFMKLLPLTLELAGLPRNEPGKLFSEGQMEVRVNTIRNAYRLARELLIDIAKPSE